MRHIITHYPSTTCSKSCSNPLANRSYEQVQCVVIESAFECDLATEDRVTDGDVVVSPIGNGYQPDANALWLIKSTAREPPDISLGFHANTGSRPARRVKLPLVEIRAIRFRYE